MAAVIVRVGIGAVMDTAGHAHRIDPAHVIIHMAGVTNPEDATIANASFKFLPFRAISADART